MMTASHPITLRSPCARVAYDWTAPDGALTAILVHRAFLRSAGPRQPSHLDQIAAELARVQSTLGVVSSRLAGEAAFGLASVGEALMEAYYWTIDTASMLADLEAASLDREISAEEIESFVSGSVARYVTAVEPAFAELGTSAASSEARAILWDAETVRTTVERALVSIYELA